MPRQLSLLRLRTRLHDSLERLARVVGTVGNGNVDAGTVDPPVIQRVDDPHGPMRLVGVSGTVGMSSIDDLFASWANLTTPYALHIDLTDANIDDHATMERLEAALDHLERQQIAVRLVGVDPLHPAIAT